MGLSRSKEQLLNATVTYRKLTIDDTITKLKAEETGLGRIDYSGSMLKGAIIVNTLYEFGSGQEAKRSYTYIEVPAGQGLYTWIDYNQDGVQQANEFELALYDDQKKFIKIGTPINDLADPVRTFFYYYLYYLRIAQAIACNKCSSFCRKMGSV